MNFDNKLTGYEAVIPKEDNSAAHLKMISKATYSLEWIKEVSAKLGKRVDPKLLEKAIYAFALGTTVYKWIGVKFLSLKK